MNLKPIHLVIFISQLRMGGAERVISKITPYLLNKNYRITIILIDDGNSFFDMPEDVRLVVLGLNRRAPTLFHSLYNLILRVKALRQAIIQESPDVILSLLPINDILTLLSTIGLDFPHVISTRDYPSIHSETPIITRLKHILYPRADMIVSVSTGVDDYYHWINANKRTVITNIPTDIPNNTTDSEVDLIAPNRHYIISAGRMTAKKNFALLVEAFGKVAEEFDDWDLIIIGDGEHLESLKKQRDSLGLTHRVILPGRRKDPFKLMQSSDLFVLTSNYEGVPNVILEAMSCGLPVITTDYFGEPQDIIDHNRTGIIVPRGDANVLASEMRKLMDNTLLREKIAKAGYQFVKNIDVPEIVKQWDQVFKNTIKNHKSRIQHTN